MVSKRKLTNNEILKFNQLFRIHADVNGKKSTLMLKKDKNDVIHPVHIKLSTHLDKVDKHLASNIKDLKMYITSKFDSKTKLTPIFKREELEKFIKKMMI